MVASGKLLDWSKCYLYGVSFIGGYVALKLREVIHLISAHFTVKEFHLIKRIWRKIKNTNLCLTVLQVRGARSVSLGGKRGWAPPGPLEGNVPRLCRPGPPARPGSWGPGVLRRLQASRAAAPGPALARLSASSSALRGASTPPGPPGGKGAPSMGRWPGPPGPLLRLAPGLVCGTGQSAGSDGPGPVPGVTVAPRSARGGPGPRKEAAAGPGQRVGTGPGRTPTSGPGERRASGGHLPAGPEEAQLGPPAARAPRSPRPGPAGPPPAARDPRVLSAAPGPSAQIGTAFGPPGPSCHCSSGLWTQVRP